MRGIFISYREEDTKPWALMLADELVDAFGEEQVFLDKDRLHAGSWREQISQALDHAKVVLVIIGRKWTAIADDSGQRRLDDPNDVHRQEIALALSHKGVTVIPVRVDQAPPPRPEELPEELRLLAEQQCRELSDSSARREVDLALLIGDIAQITGLMPKTNIDKETKSSVITVKRSLPSLKLFVITVITSVILIVILDLGFGWDLPASEKSLIIFLVLLASYVISKWHNHSRGIK